MASVATFLGNPMQFFRDNIVLVSYTATTNEPTTYDMGMEDGWCAAPGLDLGWTGVGPDSRPKKIVTILNAASANPPKFKAYWCPYQGGAFKHAFLGADANYMFTAKMDGCTFGVGSALADGSCMVVHANDGGKEQEQFDMLNAPDSPLHGDAGTRFLGPSGYRSKEGTRYTQATTFGIRSPGGWEFRSLVMMFDSALKRIYWSNIVDV
jgi:hypothetical protein